MHEEHAEDENGRADARSAELADMDVAAREYPARHYDQ